MRKTLTLAALTTFAATAAFASDAPYDLNEALSPETIAMIKQTYADDFAQPGPRLIRVAGDTEAWSADHFEMIKAAFAAGS